MKFCLNMEKKKKVHESSSIAGTVWDKRYKTTKVHVQNLKVKSTFPVVELAEKGKKRIKGTKKEGQRFYYRSSGGAFGAQKRR